MMMWIKLIHDSGNWGALWSYNIFYILEEVECVLFVITNYLR